MNRKLSIALALWSLCGCALELTKAGAPRACTADSQCSAGQVCFPEGCGDPGEGLVVEVIPNQAAGALAQDFPVVPPLKATETLEMASPAAIYGEVLRATQSSPQGAAYGGTVSFEAIGTSDLIPGRDRLALGTATVSAAQDTYKLPAPMGTLTLTAIADDPAIPPLTLPPIDIRNAGTQALQQVVFPSVGDPSLARITGYLVTSGTTPYTQPMLVQTIDVSTGKPLSQAVPTGATSGGAQFVLTTLKPSTDQAFAFEVTPLDATAVLPSATFQIPFSVATGADADAGSGPLYLAMGDFGSPMAITGKVLNQSNTAPVTGATVFVAGQVNGGGFFQSTPVQTGPDGTFSLVTLQNAAGVPFSLWILPPSDSASGITQLSLDTSALPSPLSVNCTDRVHITGSVVMPDGFTPAVGVAVHAVPIDTSGTARFPSAPFTATTDSQGNYLIAVDAAFYRLDFKAADGSLPLKSTFVDVPGDSSVDAGQLELSNGVTISGTVTFIPQPGTSNEVPAASAKVTFFRTSSGGSPLMFAGRTVAFPLAETVADTNGNYQVVLPAAPPR